MDALPFSSVFLIVILVVALWELLWKGVALWKSARNNDLAWFVCILIFNTAGILPIIYILFFSKKDSFNESKKKVSKKKQKS